MAALPALDGAVRCDAVVIGGGVAGLHAAWRLSRGGADVVLLERDVCGGGMSGRSSGFLTPDSELGLHQLADRFGDEDAAILWRTSAAGAALITNTAVEERIACDLQQLDCLFVGVEESGARMIEEEGDARRRVGFDVELYDRSTLGAIHPGGYAAGLTHGSTFALDPFAYCRGLMDVLIRSGVRVFEQSPATELRGANTTTAGGTVVAGNVVVCVDRMPRSLNPTASRQVYHAQTFLAISEPLTGAQVTALFGGRRFQVWDTTDVYTYYRLTGDDRLLLGGGSAASTFARRELDSPRVIQAVIESFKDRFPGLCDLEFTRWWPGLVDVTRDLLPVIDVDAENPAAHYVFGCAGLPWAAFGGEHAARRILGDTAPDLGRFFGWSRPSVKPTALQRIVGKPLGFAVDILGARAGG